jgi:hypothetical protein
MMPTVTQTGEFTKTTSDSGAFLNWGLIRSSNATNVYGIGTTTALNYTYTLDGTGIDVVIQDSGLQIDHPVFQDGSGNSRVQQLNWGTYSGGAFTQNANHYRDYDGHGTHCAGIACGKTYGWAKEARVYSQKLNGLEGAGDSGTGISITGDNTTKTITITNSTTPPNTFGTVVVAGTNLVADSSTDTLTINQGSGITLTATAGTDEFTIANAGVTSLTGTTNQVNVSASTGSVTLTLPQAIHTAATPTFGSVTAKNLTLGSSNNTIISTDTNGNINLDPNGTGIVNIQSPLDVDGTLNVDGATTLVGDVTINSPSTLTLLNSEGKISLGAASSTTSINRQASTVSPATAGDLVLRVPTSGKAWLVANNTIATAPVADNEIITKAALTTALSPYATTASLGTYMAIAGNLTTGNTNQVLGTGASATGSFIVKTDNTDRLTISAAGTTSIASGLGVTGNVVLNNNLNVAGTSTLTGNVTCSGNLTVNNIAWINKVIQYPLIASIAAHTSTNYWPSGATATGFTFSGTCPTDFVNKSLYYLTPIKLTHIQNSAAPDITIQDGTVTNCTASFYLTHIIASTTVPAGDLATAYISILNAGIIEDNGITYSPILTIPLNGASHTFWMLVKVIPTATTFSFTTLYTGGGQTDRTTTTPAQKIYGGFIKLA